MCCCRNEGSNVGVAMVALVLDFIFTSSDVTSTSTPAATTPTEESIPAFRGVSECGEEIISVQWILDAKLEFMIF